MLFCNKYKNYLRFVLNNLLKRILIAVIFIPLLIYSVYESALWTGIIIILVNSFALYEFAQLLVQKGIKTYFGISIIFGSGIIYFVSNYEFDTALYLFLSAMILTGSLQVLKGLDNFFESVSGNMFGLAYITFPLSGLVLMRTDYLSINGYIGDTNPASLVFIIFVSVWTCDSFAFFVGKSIGKRKLAPKMSPNKTIEGLIGGVIGGVIGSMIFGHFFTQDLGILKVIIIGLSAGTIGQIGDLVESSLKREFGVKDSSNLIPGHGGILDRIDSILFVSPVVLLIIRFL